MLRGLLCTCVRVQTCVCMFWCLSHLPEHWPPLLPDDPPFPSSSLAHFSLHTCAGWQTGRALQNWCMLQPVCVCVCPKRRVYASKHIKLVIYQAVAFHIWNNQLAQIHIFANTSKSACISHTPPPGEAFLIKFVLFGYVSVCVCVHICVWTFGVCLELALQWLVSQWRGVSLTLDCCLTSQQTEHIGSGWTERPPLGETGREEEREGSRRRRSRREDARGRRGKEEIVQKSKRNVQQSHVISVLSIKEDNSTNSLLV